MTKSRTRTRWKSWLRTLHIHLSIFGLVLILFFAGTGFVMNHEDWFEGSPREETVVGRVPAEWLSEPDRLAIVEFLRDEFGATGPLDDFEIGDDELEVSFRKPGRSTDALIYRNDGYVTVETRLEGTLSAMTQLHKGKRSGIVGSLMIDMVAAILAVTAIGGLTLWTTLPARRTNGLVFLGLGVLATAFLWWFLVL